MAETVRIATFNTELSRRGPGLLLRDIRAGDDAQVNAVVSVIATVRPDILVLQGIDYDWEGQALSALSESIARAGHSLPYRFAARPNSGIRTGYDHDGDGDTDGPRDAQGFGRFPGQGGMAILSRYPIGLDGVRDFSTVLWADVPGAILPEKDGARFPSEALYDVQRLSSVAHWDIPVEVAGTRLNVLAFHATPPVFDGPEDMNGLRNRDEIEFWSHYIGGRIAGTMPPAERFVIAGDANLDPQDGDGIRAAIVSLLEQPWLRDPRPSSPGATAAADPTHVGDPALDTVDWSGPTPGNLRVDYVLPSADLKVVGAGVYWPAPGEEGASIAQAASRHRMVWVDVKIGG